MSDNSGGWVMCQTCHANLLFEKHAATCMMGKEMSEYKTPRTDECICSFAPGGWDVGRLVMVSRTIEAELTTALQRAEKAESALCGLTPGGSEYAGDPQACVEYVRRVRESQHSVIVEFKAELSRYKEAEKALPEVRKLFVASSPNNGGSFLEESPIGNLVYIQDYDLLRTHAAALQVERDAMRESQHEISVALGVPGCNAAEMLNIIDGLREDAERYRWLKENTILREQKENMRFVWEFPNWLTRSGDYPYTRNDSIDAAIDAAMRNANET